MEENIVCLRLDYCEPDTGYESSTYTALSLVSRELTEISKHEIICLALWIFKHNSYYKGCEIKKAFIVEMMTNLPDNILNKITEFPDDDEQQKVVVGMTK